MSELLPGLRVLIVEDHLDTATSTADLLRLFGHEVAVARDGPSALETAKTSQPQVVLLDLALPKMDGYEVARRLLTVCEKKPFLVALSGYGGEDDQRRSSAAGIDLHLLKPVEPEQLRLLLEQRQQAP